MLVYCFVLLPLHRSINNEHLHLLSLLKLFFYQYVCFHNKNQKLMNSSSNQLLKCMKCNIFFHIELVYKSNYQKHYEIALDQRDKENCLDIKENL